ncbi:SGNH/GDSL hydrolase family protein [Gluconacetobacter tumulisoli]|uniref:SGNH/GDSL hydrolase family protein n=2 Tax=Gluconacetobacter tumulisoli TaxID=1286189 RepID=A0A7W4K669_9PROT|nr:SGNH/GDSL hydrolase family protein [Gluconacetobacter tumulisoli]
MKRLTLFAKGNVDVHDALHSCRIGGTVQWNGINEILRGSYPGLSMRLRHETLTRSDAVLSATGTVPASMAGRDLPLGNYPTTSQFSSALFTTPADAVFLSILPDVATELVRHRTEGYFLYPADAATWTDADRRWLRSEFAPTGFLTVEQSMENFTKIIEKLRQERDVPILIHNLSSVIPGDGVHCYLGLDETFSTRVRRFNLALVELSEATGISIVDVDTIIARHGADRMKLDTFHLTPEGYRRVAEEAVRVLADLGVFDTAREA